MRSSINPERFDINDIKTQIYEGAKVSVTFDNKEVIGRVISINNNSFVVGNKDFNFSVRIKFDSVNGIDFLVCDQYSIKE